ncbi:isoprenyl transferase [Actinomycetaceae bacterium WB03_NA08]|uniref:Isoprenyl transferase n=2 Tax=Scrofimicrobium canadense TaxID=2652290 RepID=A0A6N7W5D7_9ACTO|nr:isoprenyl transferase [Scrofimicrobium canadense]MSS83426.1 isoprenyl transferase [Scrofimicrobium canadense]
MSSGLLYGLYERRLQRELRGMPVPQHVAVILDGNRRWAKAIGSPASEGHRAGAGKMIEFLDWAEEVGVCLVTLWMLSTENLSRDESELAELLEIIASAVETLGKTGRWKLRVVGDLRLVESEYASRLSAVEEATCDIDGMEVNVAVGYGGRHELVDAVRELLLQADGEGTSVAELAESLTDADITEHLYTRGQPDPDLVIRTSGEQRLSGFMLWQSAHSEFYFCDTYWPDFRRVDFLRALRSYGQRERRMGK